MKRYAAGVAFALAALVTPAAATQLNVSVTGVLTALSPYPGNGPTDKNLAIGSQFTLSASFDASYLLQYRNTAYQIVGLYQLPNSSFSITAPGLSWDTSDIIDPTAYLGYLEHMPEAYPAIVISGDKVVGLVGALSSGDPSTKPQLDLGDLTGVFYINAPDHAHKARIADPAFDYQTPGFIGTWDFANSSVTDPPGIIVTSDAISAAPEPNTWTMLIIGFGAIGFAMRRRVAWGGLTF